jgi:outer membrane protein TolC
MQLAGVRPIDIALASERIQVAEAQRQRADVLWLPTVLLGGDYFRHDGQIQDVQGHVFGTSKTSLMVGAGPFAVFALCDAIFAPLAERQVVQSRQAALQTARNDSLLAVAEAYFNVQQARGDLAGAIDSARRADEVVRRSQELAAGGNGILADVDVVRARAEFALRDQAVDDARERWRVASADLGRILRLEPTVLVEPLEAAHLRVTVVVLDKPLVDLIALALTSRPELAAQQALVQATLVRLRQERLRPLVPSIFLRGSSTPVVGTLAGGYFGGGINDNLSNFGARSDFDVQLLWELQNLGFGNRALVDQRRAENRLSVAEFFRLQDQVAAEVAQAYAQAQSATSRLGKAENGLKDAAESASQNFKGLGQTKTATGAAGSRLPILVIRPQEAVAAVQTLSQAYNAYYRAVADYNRAQFRLYRALGQPAQVLARQGDDCLGAPSVAHPPEILAPLPPLHPQATRSLP